MAILLTAVSLTAFVMVVALGFSDPFAYLSIGSAIVGLGIGLVTRFRFGDKGALLLAAILGDAALLAFTVVCLIPKVIALWQLSHQ